MAICKTCETYSRATLLPSVSPNRFAFHHPLTTQCSRQRNHYTCQKRKEKKARYLAVVYNKAQKYFILHITIANVFVLIYSTQITHKAVSRTVINSWNIHNYGARLLSSLILLAFCWKRNREVKWNVPEKQRLDRQTT